MTSARNYVMARSERNPPRLGMDDAAARHRIVAPCGNGNGQKGPDPRNAHRGGTGAGNPVMIGADDSVEEATRSMAWQRVRYLLVSGGPRPENSISLADPAKDVSCVSRRAWWRGWFPIRCGAKPGVPDGHNNPFSLVPRDDVLGNVPECSRESREFDSSTIIVRGLSRYPSPR